MLWKQWELGYHYRYRLPGNRDLVISGKNGIVVGWMTLRLCKAIKNLYHSKELRMEFAAQNKKS